MADPTPEQLAAIDQNMTKARHYLRMQTSRYAASLELLGGREVHAQQALLETLAIETPDTLLKLLAVAIADRHAEAQRSAQVEALLESWQSRADTARAVAVHEDLLSPNALRADVYEICVKGMRSITDGA